MDAFDAIATKLETKMYAKRHVEGDIKRKVLEAARLTGSSMNSQHWRFVLVQDPKNLETLARDSTTGTWVSGADFAIIVNIDPKIPASVIDAGRVAQDMQLAAWNQGVASRVFTGIRTDAVRGDFEIPDKLNPVIVVGFGYPAKKIIGRKSRKPLSEMAYLERYGNPLGSLES